MDDKFQSYKIEIRSILLPYQKGCYLADFNRAYLELIGKRLPFREMGFKSDIELLYAMPDVVRITPMGSNNYHLMGVADDKSKHIQKMVAKQKPVRLKPPPRSFRNSNLPRFEPPRLTKQRRAQEYSYSRIQSYLHTQSPSVTLPKEEPKHIKEEPRHIKEEPKHIREEPKLPHKASPMDEVIALVQHFKNRLAVDDVLCEYKRMYSKSLSLSLYGFSSIEECIGCIPGLEMVQKNNVKFVMYSSVNQPASNNIVKNDENSWQIPPAEVSSSYNSSDTYKQNQNDGDVPTSLERKLLKVAEKYPDGILASDFPRCFEEVTGQTLDILSLGYRCLNDFIDEVPDIFARTFVTGSKKDYVIYPAKNFRPGQKAIDDESPLQHIALNLRRILVAYPEGIPLQELINVYSINCRQSLHLEDFGFDDLEKFLESIKSNVPLRFGAINGAKSIHLVKLSELPNDLPYTDPDVYNKEAIPHDAVFPEFKYKSHKFPEGFDFSVFIPAYTSSVAHAGHLYLQFQEAFGFSDELAQLGTDIDKFYNGNESDDYTMKSIHIEVGASCIAKWPADNHWYRARILSIPSMQNVKVIYIDYGTTDIIPKFLLRYAKQEFIDLPAQAVRCRLAFLKPPNNVLKWGVETRDRILALCQNVPLMAKIEEVEADGVYSVILCDTNGEDDVYINDLLIHEGLAETSLEPAESSVPPPQPKMPSENLPYMPPLQALQARYFLQAFATVAPMFSQNELYLGLLREVTALCPDPVSQSTGIPLVPAAGPPGFSSFPQGFNSNIYSDAFGTYPNNASVIGTNSVRKSKATSIPPPKDFYSAPLESPTSPLTSSPEAFPEEKEDIENEIFDDDDDELFQQFCQKISLTNMKHIKRVMLGDGYRIHIIVIDFQPYASSGEISQLIWNNKEADYLLNRLQIKDVNIPVLSISEDGHEQLFQQLLKYNVKGVQKTNGFKSSIYLYPLRDIMKILNIFGHPSVTLRTRLTEEISSFNPNDRYWRGADEYCTDDLPEDEKGFSSISYSSATDDDKIEKLCLYDLLAMKESIVCKRKRMLSSSDLSKSTEEIDKLEKLLQKVLNRIQEIRAICQDFS